MYLTNKYTRWYYNIIQQSKTRSISGYTEKHHIIPKSLGGSNSKNNLAVLTPREHFICHLLLTKMTDGINKQKMIFGLWRMSVPAKDRHRITSTQYEKIRNEFCRVNSNRHKGKINSQKSLDKRKATMLERYGTMITFTKHSSSAKKKVSDANTGRKHTKEELIKMRESHLGSKNAFAKLTEEQVIKIKQSVLSVKELSILYKVSTPTIYKIKNGSTWSHILA
jgi:hypothetical protein